MSARDPLGAADLSSAIREAEEALAKPCFLAAAREAEADVARLTRAHGGCDAQVRTLVSQGLAAIRKAEAAESALAEERRRREEAEGKLRHLCYVYGCTSHGRTPDHGPDDCAWCEAEEFLTAALAQPAPALPETVAEAAKKLREAIFDWDDARRVEKPYIVYCAKAILAALDAAKKGGPDA